MPNLSHKLIALFLPATLLTPTTCLYAQRPAQSQRETFQQRNADVSITAQGRLRANRVAIGGETTGTELQSSNFTFDLDLSRVDRGRRISNAWNGEQVRVQGELTRRRGPERGTRLVIQVRNIERVNRGRDDGRWDDGRWDDGRDEDRDRWDDGRWNDDRGRDRDRWDDRRDRNENSWNDERQEWQQRWENQWRELPTWYRNLRSAIEDEIDRN